MDAPLRCALKPPAPGDNGEAKVGKTAGPTVRAKQLDESLAILYARHPGYCGLALRKSLTASAARLAATGGASTPLKAGLMLSLISLLI